MNFRLPARATALALAAALALTACGSGSDGGDTPSPTGSPTAAASPSAADVAALAGVKVDGEAGAEPKLVFDAPLTVSAVTTRLVEDGDGAALKDGQRVSAHVVVFNGQDGTRSVSTWQENQGQADSFTLGDPALGAINDVLADAHVGARVLVANPQTGADGSVATSVMFFEVIDAKTIPTRAEGEAVTPAEGLPKVTLDDTGKPSIEIPEGYEAPAELVAQTLIKGTGPVVEDTQTITVHYTGWTLDGKQFDSSWDRGTPMTQSLQGLIPGWAQGLAGQTVGSQVLLVIPADLAYGEKSDANTHQLAGETLIFVVDILDAQ